MFGQEMFLAAATVEKIYDVQWLYRAKIDSI